MPYDWEAALQAGYSLDEVTAYLFGPNRRKIVRDPELYAQARPPATGFDRLSPPSTVPPPPNAPPPPAPPQVPVEPVPTPGSVFQDLMMAGPRMAERTGEGIATGLRDLYGPDRTAEQRVAGASDIFRTAAPYALPMARPLQSIPTALRVGGSIGLGTATGRYAEDRLVEAGVPPGFARAGADVLGFGLGRSTLDLPGALPMGAFLGGPETGAVRLGGRRNITGADVLREAANPRKMTFADFLRKNPQAGQGVFDMSQGGPAQARSVPVPRHVPAKGVPARTVDAMNNPEVTQGIIDYWRRGVADLPGNWYHTNPIFQAYVSEYGSPQKAMGPFRKFMEYVAATSSGSTLDANQRIGSYYNYLERSRLPLQTGPPPPGYGSKYWPSHRAVAEKVRTQGGFIPGDQPKEYSYVENLTGNELPLTADRHWFRLFGMLSKDPRFLRTKLEEGDYRPRDEFNAGRLTMEEALSKPTYWADRPGDNEYGAVEAFAQSIARSLGITTANLQQGAWVGGREMTGLESRPEVFADTLAKRIDYTAERMGVSRKEILKKFIRGKIPLLTLLGGAAMAPPETENEPPQQ